MFREEYEWATNAEREQIDRLRNACADGDLDVVRALLEEGTADFIKDGAGRTALHECIRCPRELVFTANKRLVPVGEPVRKILIELLENGTKPMNARDVSGETALHYANDIDIVKLLVWEGSYVDARDWRGCTPLHKACAKRNAPVVRFLLDNGADVNAVDCQARTPAHHLFATFSPGDFFARRKIAGLLAWYGAKFNTQDILGITPMHMCQCDEDVVTLLHHGGNPYLRTDYNARMGGQAIEKWIDSDAFVWLDLMRHYFFYLRRKFRCGWPRVKDKLRETIENVRYKDMQYITSSLYSAYYYWKLGVRSREEFLDFLSKKPTPPNEAMTRGIEFENAVRMLTTKFVGDQKPSDDPLEQMAFRLRGGQWQVKGSKPIDIPGYGDFLLYGIMDVVRADTIYDLKCMRKYDFNHFVGQIQHQVYMYITGIKHFAYMVYVWPYDMWTDAEDYYWSDARDGKRLREKIAEMLDDIYADAELKKAFLENWRAKDKQNDQTFFDPDSFQS